MLPLLRDVDVDVVVGLSFVVERNAHITRRSTRATTNVWVATCHVFSRNLTLLMEWIFATVAVVIIVGLGCWERRPSSAFEA